MKPGTTEIKSVIVRILPAGSNQSAIPSVTLNLGNNQPRPKPTEIPLATTDALNLCLAALRGESLDELLRKEINRTLSSHGYSIDLSQVPSIKIPAETLTLITHQNAGICLEYQNQPAPAVLANLWEPKGNQLTKAESSQIAQQIKVATQQQKPFDPFDL
jgi:hypothetical protein